MKTAFTLALTVALALGTGSLWALEREGTALVSPEESVIVEPTLEEWVAEESERFLVDVPFAREEEPTITEIYEELGVPYPAQGE